MKKNIYSFLILVSAMSCNDLPNEDSIKAFIPGWYIAYYENEFHETYDTLDIKNNGMPGASVYEIAHRCRTTTHIDGRDLPENYKVELWTGIYDEQKKIMTESKHGSVITFDPENNILKKATRIYKKIAR